LNEDIYLVKADINNLDRVVVEPDMVVNEPVVMMEKPVAVIAAPTVVAPPLLVVAETAARIFEYSGKNQKQFLILCSYPGADNMDDKHLEALKSALQRKELTLDDVAILNMAKYTAAAAELYQYFKPQRLLLLGAPCLLSGWDKFNLNQLENLNGIKALYTFSFTEMMGDRDKTKAFWEQMKVL